MDYTAFSINRRDDKTATLYVAWIFNLFVLIEMNKKPLDLKLCLNVITLPCTFGIFNDDIIN